MKAKRLLIADGWIFDHKQGSGEVWIKGHFFITYYPAWDNENSISPGCFGCCWAEDGD